MHATLKKIARRGTNALAGMAARPTSKREWRNAGLANGISERLVEYAFALRVIAETYPETLLDVGPGASAWPHLLWAEGLEVDAIDKIDGYWGSSFGNRHFYVIRGDITSDNQTVKQYDCITCLSVIEHIPDHIAAVRGMHSRLKPGGLLILTCPYNEKRYVENCYELPEATWGTTRYITRQYSRAQLNEWAAVGFALEEKELWLAMSGEAWATGVRLTPPTRAREDESHQLGCFRLRKQ